MWQELFTVFNTVLHRCQENRCTIYVPRQVCMYVCTNQNRTLFGLLRPGAIQEKVNGSPLRILVWVTAFCTSEAKLAIHVYEDCMCLPYASHPFTDDLQLSWRPIHTECTHIGHWGVECVGCLTCLHHNTHNSCSYYTNEEFITECVHEWMYIHQNRTTLHSKIRTCISHPAGVVEGVKTLKPNHLQNRARVAAGIGDHLSQMGVHGEHIITWLRRSSCRECLHSHHT